jgi:hypothetical protein
MEWLDLGPGVGIGERNGWIESIDGLRVGDPERREAAGSIGAELSEVHIERAIFL